MSTLLLLNAFRQELDERDEWEKAFRAALESDVELTRDRKAHDIKSLERAARDAAKLARLDRLMMSSARHPNPWAFWRLRRTYDAISIALIDPTRQRCPVCDELECDVWGDFP